MEESSFQTVLARLDEWRTEVVEHLRQPGGDPGTLAMKLELDAAIRCLEFCRRHHLTPAGLTVLELPATGSGPYPEFRLLDDCETEERAVWVEVQVGGEPVRAYPGDLLVGRR